MKGFSLQMLFKIENVRHPRRIPKVCHVSYVSSGCYWLFFVPIITYRAFSLILPNEFSSFCQFFLRKMFCDKEGIGPAQLSMDKTSRGPPWAWAAFPPLPLSIRTPLSIVFLLTAWKLSILRMCRSSTERHFKNSRFRFYHQKTSIKYASAPGARCPS